ncbi:MAG: hypothetical protein RLZ84_1378 [Actinomycetota bacterium]
MSTVRFVAIHSDPMPEAPTRLFASDNASGVHPRYLAAIERVNEGHALAYGQDAATRAATSLFTEFPIMQKRCGSTSNSRSTRT